MNTLRNLSRRKLRTGLTVMGITIGIWALVVFSSMAAKIDSLVSGGSRYYEGKVVVTESSGGLASFVPLSMSLVPQIEGLDGVAAVAPQIAMLYDSQAPTMSFGVPPMVSGGIPGSDKGLETFPTSAAEGRQLEAADLDLNVVVLGSDLARKYDKHAGDSMEIRGRSFLVIGVLEPTLTAPDNTAEMPLPAAQQLYLESLPAAVRGRLQASNLATAFAVYPEPGVDPEELASTIERVIPNTAGMTGADFDQQIGAATGILNAIIIGVALISLIVGGLSVINTMAMSVAERTREIGIKRAIGGSRARVVRELVVEAGVIGLIGGLIGLALGSVVVYFADEAGRSGGTVLFQLTPQIAVFAVGFSVILGIIAGIVPALHAARLDPVAALRYE